MQNRFTMLKSKLLCPESGDGLHRKKINDKLCRVKSRKLALLCAGSGYGKTTTASLFIQKIGAKHTWYKISNDEKDFLLFVKYLIKGVQLHVKGFCDQNLENQYLEWGVNAVGAYIAKELEKKVTYDFYFILDDWHLVEDSSQIADLICFLIENTIRNIHFILTSQNDSELPIAKLISSNDAVIVNDKDLRFSKDEASFFFTGSNFREQDIADLVSKAVEKTGGWAAGLKLIAHSIYQKDIKEAFQLIDTISGANKIFSNYLETEVFNKLSEIKKNF